MFHAALLLALTLVPETPLPAASLPPSVTLPPELARVLTDYEAA